MASGIKLKDIDKGWNALKKDLKDLRGSYVKVGILGAKAAQTHPDENGEEGKAPLTNVDLAVIHEFGAPAANIPARPFVSGSYQRHAVEYQALLQKGMKKVYSREMTIAQMLGLIGAQAAADMKAYVIQGKSPLAPLKADTVDAKGSDRPLVDTGRMIGSVTWGVKLGSKPEKEGGS